MSEKEAQEAVEYLEERYDWWDRETYGWVQGSPAGRTSYLFNFRDDVRRSCSDGSEICFNHAGEAYFGNVNPAAFGHGVYYDRHFDTEMPCYGIELDHDAWKDPHP